MPTLHLFRKKSPNSFGRRLRMTKRSPSGQHTTLSEKDLRKAKVRYTAQGAARKSGEILTTRHGPELAGLCGSIGAISSIEFPDAWATHRRTTWRVNF